MRPTFVHVLTGLLLGTAGRAFERPSRIVAHQESISPVRPPDRGAGDKKDKGHEDGDDAGDLPEDGHKHKKGKDKDD
jgi:hypothetical protein